MKAAVLEELNRIVVKEVETPQVSEGCILVRVRACAVCGSDIRIFRHGNPRVRPPQVIGHEIAGEVAQVGQGVKGFRAGDRVAIGADVPCGECYFCLNGLGNNCPTNYAIGYQFPGGFAECILLNPTTVRFGPVAKMPNGVSFEEAALAEPLACCINGLELSQVGLGDTVLIVGAGPAGCMLTVLSRAMGASKVIIAQRSKPRLEMAKRFEADAYISTLEEDLVERAMEESGGLGADVVITACASPEVQEQALLLVKNRGRVNFFGGLPKGRNRITIDSNIIHYKECFVHGSHGCVPRHHKLALELIKKGVIKPKDFISHRFPLERIKEAFDIVENRQGMKVVVNP